MKYAFQLSFLLSLWFYSGCSTQPKDNSILDMNVSQEVTIIGTAQNEKLGAVIIADANTFYIESISSWNTEAIGKLVEVTGTLAIRYDKPVFLESDLDTSERTQGIPVSNQSELQETSKAYYLKNATWKIIP